MQAVIRCSRCAAQVLAAKHAADDVACAWHAIGRNEMMLCSRQRAPPNSRPAEQGMGTRGLPACTTPGMTGCGLPVTGRRQAVLEETLGHRPYLLLQALRQFPEVVVLVADNAQQVPQTSWAGAAAVSTVPGLTPRSVQMVRLTVRTQVTGDTRATWAHIQEHC